MGPVSIGIDIGQKVDPTAIAVVEEEERTETDEQTKKERTQVFYVVRRLERLPLGMPYPKIRARLATIIEAVRARAAETHALTTVQLSATLVIEVPEQAALPPTVYVDATGVGQPVVDELRHAGVRVTPVYFTHGDRRTMREDGGISLGKAWLVSRLQVLLQNGRLLLPDTDDARVLAKELQDYELRVSEQANDTYGAFKVGTHDDLVTAVGLAIQGSGKRVMAWA
jgi:Terminase RNaseH-like domain